MEAARSGQTRPTTMGFRAQCACLLGEFSPRGSRGAGNTPSKTSGSERKSVPSLFEKSCAVLFHLLTLNFHKALICSIALRSSGCVCAKSSSNCRASFIRPLAASKPARPLTDSGFADQSCALNRYTSSASAEKLWAARRFAAATASCEYDLSASSEAAASGSDKTCCVVLRHQSTDCPARSA